jgi:hypothetical protein
LFKKKQKKTHSLDIFVDLAAFLKAFDDQIKELQMNLTRMMTLRLIPIQSTGCVYYIRYIEIINSNCWCELLLFESVTRFGPRPKCRAGRKNKKKKMNEKKKKNKKNYRHTIRNKTS